MFKPNCYSDIIGASRVSVSLYLAKSHFFVFLLLWTRRFKGTVADIKQSLDSAPRQKRCLEYLPFNGIICQIVFLLRYLIWPGSNKVCGSMGETHTVRKSSASSSFAYATQNPTGVKQPWQKLFFRRLLWHLITGPCPLSFLISSRRDLNVLSLLCDHCNLERVGLVFLLVVSLGIFFFFAHMFVYFLKTFSIKQSKQHHRLLWISLGLFLFPWRRSASL